MTCASSFALALFATIGVAHPASAQGAADPARTGDAAFVAKAADVVSVDTELATLAATRATAPAVKALAQRIVDARSVIARDLEAMAETRRIGTGPRPASPPVAAATPAITPVASLRSQPRRAFDAAFLTALLANGEAAVALFEAESRDGRDDEIKEWAARQLPALREHLTAIRGLRPRPGS